MRIEPAIPWTFPRATPRDRALRWFAAAVTVVVATAAVLGAAMTAVMLAVGSERAPGALPLDRRRRLPSPSPDTAQQRREGGAWRSSSSLATRTIPRGRFGLGLP